MKICRFLCQTNKGQVYSFGSGETKEAAWLAAKQILEQKGYYVTSYSVEQETDIDPDVHL